MEIGHLKQSLYPRAVTASVEGSLRPENPEAAQTPFAVRHVKPNTTQQAAQREQRPVRDDNGSRRAHEALTGSTQQRTEFEHANAALAAQVGDKLAQATRLTRQDESRRGYLPEALVSRTGRRALQGYQQAEQLPASRLLDELV